MDKVSRRKFLFLASSILAIISYPFWVERFYFQTNSFKIKNPSISGIKILQLSDLHINSLNGFYKRIVKKVNSLNPDIICFSGDSVDNRFNLDLLDEFLSLLEQKIPKVAILGNWEYWGKVNINSLKKIYAKHNCVLLINESKSFKMNQKVFRITGFDDLIAGTPVYDASNEECHFHLVLAHCPSQRDVISKKGIKSDLVLSGHTHGGQVNLFGFSPFIPRGSGQYISGWYDDNFYVSKGIGTSIFPVRIGSKSEISLFEFV